MAYKPTSDKTAGYISPFHKELLQRLAETQKRSIRAGLENIIEHYAFQEFGAEYFFALKEAYQADTQVITAASPDSSQVEGSQNASGSAPTNPKKEETDV